MKRAMSVAALKRNMFPRITARRVHADDVVKNPAAYSLSRRQALGIVGLGSLAAAPLSSALDKALSADFVLRRRGNRVAFSVAGKDRWVIDPSRFDGAASLHVSEDDKA